jgi:hypothetical protein
MDKNKDQNKQTDQTERINLNDYERTDDKGLREHTDDSLNDLDKNLNEQFGGTGKTVISKPNYT